MANEKFFPWRPRPGPQISNNPRTVSVSFGDGYEEIKPDGLNFNLKKYNQNYRIVGDYERQRVNAFLNEHGAHKAFFIFSESRQKNVLVRADSWTETPHTGAGYVDYSINFREVVK